MRRCAQEEPAQFVKVVASLMPRDITLTATVDAASIAENFRAAVALLGNEVTELPPPRPPLRRIKVIT